MSLTKKIGLLTLGQGINVVVNILFLPYMARALSYEDYGTYGQTLLITSIVTTFLTLGLPQLLNVYLADRDRDDRISISSNLTTSLLLGVFGTIVGLAFADYFGVLFGNDKLPKLIQIYSLSVLFSIPFSSLNSFFIFKGRVKLSVYLSVFTNILKIILVVISIQLYKSLSLAVWSMVFITFLQFLISVLCIKNLLVLNFNLKLIKEQIKEGLPLGMTAVIGILILYSDSTMISVMLDIKEYAIYRNGAIEVPFVSTLYASIAAVVLPEVAKYWQNEEIDTLFVLKKKVVMNTVYLLYPILVFLIFNSRTIISLYLGEKYIESGVIFAVFNLTLLIRVVSYSDILISAKKTRFIMFTYVIVVLINILLNYFLISWIGGLGAAVSTVFSLMLLAIMQMVRTLQISKKKLIDLVDLKKVIVVLIISIVVGFIMFLLTKDIHSKWLGLTVFSIGYGVLIFFLFNYFKFYSKELYEKLFPKRIIKLLYKK